MQRQPVSSSNIASIGYDPASEVLEIEFLNNSIYQYFNVPSSIFGQLMAASSHGTYLSANIKGRYQYVRL